MAEATKVTNELIFEILKKIQADIADVKDSLSDHTRQFIRLREEIHNLRGDDLRREVVQAQMDNRLERIETRLGLVDA